MMATKKSDSAACPGHTARCVPRSALSPRPAASIPCPSAQPTGDHGAHHTWVTARRHASSTKPDTLLTKSSARTPAKRAVGSTRGGRSEEHTSELQSREKLVCRLLLEKKKAAPTTDPWARHRHTRRCHRAQ